MRSASIEQPGNKNHGPPPGIARPTMSSSLDAVFSQVNQHGQNDSVKRMVEVGGYMTLLDDRKCDPKHCQTENERQSRHDGCILRCLTVVQDRELT